MKDAPVIMNKDKGIARVTLNRPDVRNAIDATMTAEITRVFDEVEADDSVRVTILAGTGPVFCAGMDLRHFAEHGADAVLFGPYGFAGFVKRNRTKPVIAAVQGAALAGGFEIMLACDLAVASDDAVFGLPEPKLGLIAGGGGAIRLPQIIPRVLANEMLLTGDTFSAGQMLDWGLLNAVVPASELSATAQTLATRIAVNAPLSLRKTLDLARSAGRDAMSRLWDENDATMRDLSATSDIKEGISAYLEKRAPRWQAK